MFNGDIKIEEINNDAENTQNANHRPPTVLFINVFGILPVSLSKKAANGNPATGITNHRKFQLGEPVLLHKYRIILAKRA